MPSIDQQLFNIVLAVAGALGGWWMKAMWESVKKLEVTDQALTKEVGELKILVADEYMKRDEFERTSNAILNAVDRQGTSITYTTAASKTFVGSLDYAI